MQQIRGMNDNFGEFSIEFCIFGPSNMKLFAGSLAALGCMSKILQKHSLLSVDVDLTIPVCQRNFDRRRKEMEANVTTAQDMIHYGRIGHVREIC